MVMPVLLQCNELQGSAVFFKDTKEQVVIHSAIGLDKVNEGDERW